MSSFKRFGKNNSNELSDGQIYKIVNSAMDQGLGEEGEDLSDEAIREKQKRSLFTLLDVIVEYTADSNRMELDECQDAVRQTTMALMRLEAEETLSRSEMMDFEILYDEFRR